MSPDDYYREGEGSLMQCVLTPADPYLPLPNEEIARRVDEQVCDPQSHAAMMSLLVRATPPCNWPAAQGHVLGNSPIL